MTNFSGENLNGSAGPKGECRVNASNKYQAYAEYKDSGVDILGSIPSNWRMWKLNHFAPIITCGVAATPEYLDDGISFLSAQNVKQRKIDLSKGFKFISKQKHEELTKNREPRNGDILLSRVGTVGEACVVNVDFPFSVFVSLTHLRLDNSICNNDFFVWLCESAYVKGMHGIVTLVGGGVGNLNVNDLREYKLPIPQIDEQKNIANFLDHETAKIDTLIEKQQQLIQLLKEKRQAVISHAVTKGLNPDAPMKDSGVEWLGEVPEHWVICGLKHIKSLSSNAFVDGPFGSNLKSEHFIDNGDVYVIESNFATTGEIDTTKLKTISNAHFETIRRSEATDGDIIIAKIGARFGMSSILPLLDKKSVVSGNSLKLSVNTNLVTREYAHKLLTVLKESGAMDDGVNGSAQPALSLGELNNLIFLVPPIDEQNQIEKYIELKQRRFDALLAKADIQVSLLQERRTALISAAVTGKIDVRNWQAPQN